MLQFPENTSDHSPIFCNILNTSESSTSLVDEENDKRFNIASLKSSDWGHYADILGHKLGFVQVPACANCKNVHCKYTTHVADIDDVTTRETTLKF